MPDYSIKQKDIYFSQEECMVLYTKKRLIAVKFLLCRENFKSVFLPPTAYYYYYHYYYYYISHVYHTLPLFSQRNLVAFHCLLLLGFPYKLQNIFKTSPLSKLRYLFPHFPFY